MVLRERFDNFRKVVKSGSSFRFDNFRKVVKSGFSPCRVGKRPVVCSPVITTVNSGGQR